MKDEDRPASTPYKLQITFDPEALKTLNVLRRAMGPDTSAADVVRHALGLLEWARRTQVAGYSVATIRDGRIFREVELPFVEPLGVDDEPPTVLPAGILPEPA